MLFKKRFSLFKNLGSMLMEVLVCFIRLLPMNRALLLLIELSLESAICTSSRRGLAC